MMDDSLEHNSVLINNSKMKSQSLKQLFVPVTNEECKSLNIIEKTIGCIEDNCVPSKKCAQSYINRLFPFLTWLKQYEVGWLPTDILCGVTVSENVRFDKASLHERQMNQKALPQIIAYISILDKLYMILK
ncbi:unnamed protein product [Rotaria sp. Silwood2]|nr:unnamed protein product [Rotaria sp. Silwood2]CAF3320155.1 unnamed protein product [Rotaria sp. Silwood2]CAF3965893.1 unnamed protein product [Rotaria sp. Silwood2]CAF4142918.1 unnamed protein product [Rotaria sp. Silwood2]